MKHADKLIKRVLFLGGLPNLQDLGKLMIGENVHEVLTCDLSLEMRSLPDLKLAIPHCETVKDFVTRELFTDILESEEEHIDWLQTQFRLIEQMGIENFVQLQTKPNEERRSYFAFAGREVKLLFLIGDVEVKLAQDAHADDHLITRSRRGPKRSRYGDWRPRRRRNSCS